jgi:hypothetical protein
MYIVLSFVECCIMGGHDDLHVRVIAGAAIGCSVIRRIYTPEFSLLQNFSSKTSLCYSIGYPRPSHGCTCLIFYFKQMQRDRDESSLTQAPRFSKNLSPLWELE